MNYLIREATINDIASLGYIHYTSWNETYTGLVNQYYLDNRSIDISISMFKSMDLSNIIVLEVSGNVVGFVSLGRCRDKDLDNSHGEIQAIYILKEYQRQGLGKKLLDFSCKKLTNLGYQKCVVWVLETNHNSLSFYQKNQFIKDGRIKEIVLGTPVNVIRLIKIMN